MASLSLDAKPGASQMSRQKQHSHHPGASQKQMTSGGGSSSSGLPPYLQNHHRYSSLMTDSPDAAAMSPGLSSVATSTTSGDVEVSQKNNINLLIS